MKRFRFPKIGIFWKMLALACAVGLGLGQLLVFLDLEILAWMFCIPTEIICGYLGNVWDDMEAH